VANYCVSIKLLTQWFNLAPALGTIPPMTGGIFILFPARSYSCSQWQFLCGTVRLCA